MAKTSPELLTEILGVLGNINSKIESLKTGTGTESSKKGTKGLGLDLGEFAQTKTQKLKDTASAIKELSSALGPLSSGLIKFALIPGVLKRNLIHFIRDLLMTSEIFGKPASKAAKNVAEAMNILGEALPKLSKGVLKFAIMEKTGLIKSAASGIKTLIGTLTDSIKGLNKQLVKTNLEKLNSLIQLSDARTKKTSGLAAAAKDMGLALIYTATGVAAFVGTFYLAKTKLGMSPWEILGFIAATFLVLSISMMMLSGADAASEKLAGGILSKATTLKGFKASKADKGRNKGAIQGAKDMGIAMMFIAGGILAFAGTLILVPLMLGLKNDKKEPAILAGVGVIAAIIIGLAGTIALLGFVDKFVGPGIAAAKGIGIALAFMSLGVLAVAFSSKILMSMGDPEAVNKKGEKRGKFGQMMAGIGAGLGMFGLFMISAVGLFWAMGFPLVSGPVILGAISLIAVSLSLLLLVKATKKITEAVNELGGKKGFEDLSLNIRLLVGGVMGAVIDGVMGNLDKPGKHGESPDGRLSLRELNQFRRVTRAIRMFGRIATSLSRFAQGLKAFSKLGEIASLEYEEDAEGNMKPKLDGTKIHVVTIANAIADTFGLFIKTMIEKTTGLTVQHGRALRRFSKALTGDRGLISGVSEFATALKTFAEFGAEQKIWVPIQYKNPDIENEKERNAASNIVEGTGTSIPIKTIADNIAITFTSFVDSMVGLAPSLESMNINRMSRFTEALMGRERGFLGIKRAKPGLLTAITSFSNTLAEYAKYGKNNLVPIRDPKTGEVTGTMTMTEIATQMVVGISSFVSEFEKAAGKEGLEAKAESIKDKISKIVNIIGVFDKLATAQEGMEKLANSMGLLATNVGLLVTNMGGLNTENLSKLATITAQHAVTTKGVPIAPITKSSTVTTPIVAPTDWNKVAEIIGNKVAEKLTGMRNGEFNFTFYDGNSGGKLEIKEK